MHFGFISTLTNKSYIEAADPTGTICNDEFKDWVKVNSRFGKFTARFPSKPKFEAERTESSKLRIGKYFAGDLSIENETAYFYSAKYIMHRFRASERKKIANLFLKSSISDGFKATTTKSGNRTINGKTFYYAQFKGPFQGTSMITFTDHGMYVLTVYSLDPIPKKSLDYFLASFNTD